MKVTESFAIEATEEVRKDQRFEWYVNWLKSLENHNVEGMRFPEIFGKWNCVGICEDFVIQTLQSHIYGEIITLDEVYSRYGKEIYEANGIEQPFQGSREYDEKLLSDWMDFYFLRTEDSTISSTINNFINNRYPNESILKQIAEKEAEIEELKKQLR